MDPNVSSGTAVVGARRSAPPRSALAAKRPLRRWLAVLLLSPCMGGAADLSPLDFAYGMPLTAAEEAAAYRLALPVEVYRGSVREDLGDLRIFNAQGEAVPYSLIRPTPRARTREPAIGLPLFPLHDTVRVVLQGSHIAIDAPGSSARAHTPGGDADAAVNQYVIDGRQLNSAVAALELVWPDTAPDYSGRIKVEASDDLNSWQIVVAAAPTANLHANGQSLVENRVGLPPTKAKFWRVSWVGPPPRFELSAVAAEPADSPVESAYDSLEVDGTRSPAEADAELFDLGAPLPVSRLNIELPEINTVNTIELSSRRAPGDPWRVATQSGFYRLKTTDGEQHNAPLDIGVDRDRYWRARIVRGGGIAGAALRLHVEWVPHEITFLARGHGPFMLVYGSSTIAGADIDMSQLPADVDIARASTGRERIEGGASRLEPRAAPVPRLRIVLWAALVLALGLCGWTVAQRARR